MGSRLDRAILRAMGATDHQMTVLRITDLTPGFRRIRLHAPTIIDGRDTPAASYLRLWAPDPEVAGKVHQRGFTLVDPDPATGEVSLDFVHHEPGGPASIWAAKARPGDRIAASYFAYKKFTPQDVEPAGYLLAGDAAVVPAINAILAVLPAETRITLILQAHQPGDAQIPLAGHPGVELLWTGPGTDALADAVPIRDWSNWHAWIAGESLAVKALRKRLNETHGFPLTDVVHAAYWIRGKEMRLRKERVEDDPAADQVAEAGGRDSGVAAPAATQPPAVAHAAPLPGTWRSQAAAGILSPLKWKLRIAAAVQVAASLMRIAPLILLAEIARRVLDGSREWDDFAAPVVAALVLFGAAGIVSAALLLWLHAIDAAFGEGLRLRVLGKLSRLPLGWFSDRNTTAVRQAVDTEAGRLHYRNTHAVPDLVAAIVTPAAAIVYLFTVNAGLAGLLFLPLVAYVVLLIRMIVGEGDNIARVAEWSSRAASAAGGFVDALPVMRIFGGGVTPLRDTLAGQAGFLGSWQRSMMGRKLAAQMVLQPQTFLAVICAGGLWLVGRGSMTAPDIVPFLILGTAFGSQVGLILQSRLPLRDADAATRAIGQLLSEPELDLSRATQDLPAGPVGLSFRGVSFGYRAGRPVLHDVTLDCPPGSLTALVGPSGGGKTTLALLAGRFFDAGAGTVCLTAQGRTIAIRSLRPDALQRAVGFVFQDVRLIAGSLADNIRLARPDASDAQLREAAEAARIHARIMALPRGYDSVIGQDVRLSGGEAQRLSIARTLLADPPVLILDEATAMADPDSEQSLHLALNRVAEGRTVLMIAHRLQTVTGADRIAVFKDGRIVQQGRHDALLAKRGVYADLWTAGLSRRETMPCS